MVYILPTWRPRARWGSSLTRNLRVWMFGSLGASGVGFVSGSCESFGTLGVWLLLLLLLLLFLLLLLPPSSVASARSSAAASGKPKEARFACAADLTAAAAFATKAAAAL
eukprot:CAMPEP_0195030650 /NCGR_PEP_ID=MMETSP0326_2-20130528/59393_1 /TAXON_ID=2866 ORGANISM="Crypthecodinium cohnii, Strain Seligo" /NCGR_SAMPLE_ID=MMETSP0326_2 /ASSEMBLY_ACC=CAM_ASM_000348 /LENGTH=109 /DNA_ID=CAMNT_0040054015 /DNA_START=133 /DNA_END=459 /DNA_ORIENTATION=-